MIFAVWVVAAISRSALENLRKHRRGQAARERSQVVKRVVETSPHPKACRREVERLSEWLIRRANDSEAWLARGLYYQVLGELNLATSDLSRAIELLPEDPYLLLNRAQLLLHQERGELAVADLDRALEIRPGYTDCHLLRAWCLFRLGRTEEADRDLALVLSIPFDEGESLLSRAELQLAIRNDHEGTARDAEAASKRMKSARALYLWGTCRERVGQTEQAEFGFRELAAFETNNPVELGYRGYAKYWLKDMEAARQDLAAATDAAPFDLQTRRCLAATHLNLGEMDAALCDCEAVLSRDCGTALDYVYRAMILADRGDYSAAISDYERALELDPTDGTVYLRLAWLLATCPDDAVRKGPEAVRLARRACDLMPASSPFSKGTLAAAFAESGDFEAAIQWEETARSLATADERKEWNFLLDLYRSGRTYRAPLHYWRDRARKRLSASVG